MDVRPAARKPLIRRDADGAERTAPNWESLTERLIREAIDAGQFEDLPGQGEPLSLADDTYTGELTAAYGLLRDAGLAPAWIEADKEARRSVRAIDAVLDRAPRTAPISHARLRDELEQLLDRHDAAATILEASAPTPRQHRRRLDREALRARLEEKLQRTAR